MSGDYTRFTFDHKKNYAGVFKQQGRVSLDADWNEYIEIQDRRWRSETMDIIGPKDKGLGIVTEATPDAFMVTPTGLGEFTIGNGRIYVDGIQVESHGHGNQEYRECLAELQGTENYSYSDQPYFPAPLPPNLTDEKLPPIEGRSDLFYLHTWHREVTSFEDTDLREKALGGPDTTTRQQTVWQVKVLPDSGEHDCDDEIEKWNEIIAPSAGRLTTNAIGTSTSDDPCIIPPEGGYRGIENRLYRVEIHTPGPIGTAEFKWSQNNASIAASVTKIDNKQITIAGMGPGNILRFSVGNWIEILDDNCEFAGKAGHMAKVTAIDEANCKLTIDPIIPNSFNFEATDPHRHTRIRLWDQELQKVTAGPNDLENKIQISFNINPDDPTGEFKLGDYWVFWARTADGTVEKLIEAPPKGIKHHFCKLAFVRWGDSLATTNVKDCRVPWPPKAGVGCCTFVVSPGEDIQKAIDSLPDEGGCICLKPGIHEITSPIRIEKSGVVLRGESPGTTVLRRTGAQVIKMGRTKSKKPFGGMISNILVEGIRFRQNGPPADGDHLGTMVMMYECQNVKIQTCTFQADLRTKGGFYISFSKYITIENNIIFRRKLNYTATPFIGIYAISTTIIRIIKNWMKFVDVGVFAGSDGVMVNENSISSNYENSGALGFIGVFLESSPDQDIQKAYRTTCCQNSITGFQRGIIVGSYAKGSNIEGNNIRIPTGLVNPYPGNPWFDRVNAIDVSSPLSLIRNNSIFTELPMEGGIRVTEGGNHTLIEKNKIIATKDIDFGMVGYLAKISPSLYATNAQPSSSAGSSTTKVVTIYFAIDVAAPNCKVSNNMVISFLFPINGVRVTSTNGLVDENILYTAIGNKEESTIGIFVQPSLYHEGTIIRRNQLENFTSAIKVSWCNNNRITENRIKGIDYGEGIVLSNVKDTIISGNQVSNCGIGVKLYRGNNVVVERNNIRKIYGGIFLGVSHLQMGKGYKIQKNIFHDGEIGVFGSTYDVEFADNEIVKMRRVGISLGIIDYAFISNNRLQYCGYKGFHSIQVVSISSFWYVGGRKEVKVVSCEVIDSGLIDGDSSTDPCIGISISARSCYLQGNHVGYSKPKYLDVKKENRALKISPLSSQGSAVILDNKFIGNGLKALVEDTSAKSTKFQEITFNNNFCEHYNGKHAKDRATVWLAGEKLIVMGNYIKGLNSSEYNSFNLNRKIGASRKSSIFLGNVTTGQVINNDGLPSPEDNYNLVTI